MEQLCPTFLRRNRVVTQRRTQRHLPLSRRDVSSWNGALRAKTHSAVRSTVFQKDAAHHDRGCVRMIFTVAPSNGKIIDAAADRVRVHARDIGYPCFIFQQILHTRVLFQRPFHVADQLCRLVSLVFPDVQGPGNQAKHSILIEPAVLQIGLRPADQLELTALFRSGEIDPPLCQPRSIIVTTEFRLAEPRDLLRLRPREMY